MIMRFWQNSSNPLCIGRRYVKFVPTALILVIVATVISYSVNNSVEWDIIGDIPMGLPQFTNFFNLLLDPNHFWSLWSHSFLIFILSVGLLYVV